MIAIEVLENKTFFRDGMMLVGPLDRECLIPSIIQIASELDVKPVLILCLYIGNRNKAAERDDEEVLIHNISADTISVFNQTQ